MIDSPTLTSATVANYCVLNPLANPNNPTVTITSGNLNFSYSAGTSNKLSVVGSIGVNSGKYYYEFTVGSPNNCQIGITEGLVVGGSANGTTFINYYSGGINNSVGSVSGSPASFTAGDIIGVAYDMTTPAVYFYKNNTLQATVTSFSSFTAFPLSSPETGAANGSGVFNFGQRPFSYTPPTGFVRLNTYNLPDSTIKKGNTVMDATLYTGTGATQSITNAGGFKPDLVWAKTRSTVSSNLLYDSIRGVNVYLSSNQTAAEATLANSLTAFNSNGFTVGSDSNINGSGVTYVGWQWQAGQGTNTTGTGTGGITSVTQSVNTTAGFSIVTYTGSGSNGTVTHGLGVAPSMIIIKARAGADASTRSWSIYNKNLGNTSVIWLDLTSAVNTSRPLYWNSTSPTSSVFSIGTDTDVNRSSQTYVAYCWAEIAGFSKFGSYTGNASTDGPFVYTGFRPKFVLLKRTDSTSNWYLFDTARNTFNVMKDELLPNSTNAEADNTRHIDTLSNGFKIRADNASQINASGATMIYMAFAENPFKNANAR
jgi:hypothetical protein